MFSDDILAICIFLHIKDSWLEIRKMDLKANHIRDLLLHIKHIELPESLIATDVACIQVLLYLITTSAKLHGGVVMALIHILVDVLDCLDRSNRLDIDMAPVLPDKI
jgi:hypothetical protein